MADTGVPWACEACDAPNAGYRRRCQECGARRPAEPIAAPPEGPVAADGIPMPLLARRPRRQLGRVSSIVLTIVVVALAAYGAVSYFGADTPTAEDDEAALIAALPPDAAYSSAPFDDVPVDRLSVVIFCADLGEEIRAVLDEHATALVEGYSPAASLISFDASRSSMRFVELVQRSQEPFCLSTVATVGREGRVAILVSDDEPDHQQVLDEILGRLELEG